MSLTPFPPAKDCMASRTFALLLHHISGCCHQYRFLFYFMVHLRCVCTAERCLAYNCHSMCHTLPWPFVPSILSLYSCLYYPCVAVFSYRLWCLSTFFAILPLPFVLRLSWLFLRACTQFCPPVVLSHLTTLTVFPPFFPFFSVPEDVQDKLLFCFAQRHRSSSFPFPCTPPRALVSLVTRPPPPSRLHPHISRVIFPNFFSFSPPASPSFTQNSSAPPAYPPFNFRRHHHFLSCGRPAFFASDSLPLFI